MAEVDSIRVLGLHPLIPSDELFEESRDVQWGADLSGEALERANENVREHFAGLYLFEIAVDPPDAEIDWMKITQPAVGKPRDSWQVPYDERQVGQGRWVFFLHFVDLDQPLHTQFGQVKLPAPSPMPSHLADCHYEVPG